MTCTEEEKIQWFKDTVGDTIAKVLLQGDTVDELIVVDQLYDCAAEALADMPLPTSFPEQQNLTREQLASNFTAFCKGIVLRTATHEQLAVVNEDLPPELIFIRPVTRGMKVHSFIESWDNQIGFSAGLKQSNCPFEFSFDDKKLLFGFSYLMSCLSANAQEPAQPEMFKMN